RPLHEPGNHHSSERCSPGHSADCGSLIEQPTLLRIPAPTPRPGARSMPLKMVYRGGCGSVLDAERASPSVAMNGSRSGDLEHRGRSDEMAHFVGLDVSVKETSVCVVDDAGKVILE